MLARLLGRGKAPGDFEAGRNVLLIWTVVGLYI
jgi:hypothetical protein